MPHPQNLFLVAFCITIGCGTYPKPTPDPSPSKKTPATLDDLSAQAEAAWKKRLDLVELDKAISVWEKMHETLPSDKNVLLRLSRSHFLRGEHFQLEGKLKEALQSFEKGVLAGEKGMLASSDEFAERVKSGEKVSDALSSLPNSSQATLYWYAVNLGKFASLKGLRTSLFYKNRLISIMQHVLNLNESFYYGAPHRYLGAYFAKAPGFAGGDMVKAKAHFEKAIALAPNFFANHLTYAEFFAIKTEDKGLFVRLIDTVLKGNPRKIEELEPEQRLEQHKATKLQAQENTLF